MSPKINLEKLPTFLKVVECGGFSRAAEQIHLLQSSVSRQVTALENSVGKPLFVNRHAKTLTLTKEGQLVYRLAKAVQQETQLLEDNLRSIQKSSKMDLTIDSELEFCYPPLLKQLSTYLELRDVKKVTFMQILDHSESSNILLTSRQPSKNQGDSVVVGNRTYGLYGQADYLNGKIQSLSKQDLADHKLLALESQLKGKQRASNVIFTSSPKETSIETFMTFSCIDELFEAVKSTYGLAWLPDDLVTHKALNLQKIPVRNFSGKTHETVFLVFPRGFETLKLG